MDELCKKCSCYHDITGEGKKFRCSSFAFNAFGICPAKNKVDYSFVNGSVIIHAVI